MRRHRCLFARKRLSFFPVIRVVAARSRAYLTRAAGCICSKQHSLLLLLRRGDRSREEERRRLCKRRTCLFGRHGWADLFFLLFCVRAREQPDALSPPGVVVLEANKSPTLSKQQQAGRVALPPRRWRPTLCSVKIYIYIYIYTVFLGGKSSGGRQTKKRRGRRPPSPSSFSLRYVRV